MQLHRRTIRLYGSSLGAHTTLSCGAHALARWQAAVLRTVIGSPAAPAPT